MPYTKTHTNNASRWCYLAKVISSHVMERGKPQATGRKQIRTRVRVQSSRTQISPLRSWWSEKNRDVWYYDATALCQLHHPMVIFQDPAKASHHSEIQVSLTSSSDGDTVSHMETYFHIYLFTKWDFKSMRNKVTVFKWSNLTLLFVPMSCNAPNVSYVPSAAGPYPCWWQWSWTCDSEHGHSQGGSHKQHLAPEKTHRGSIWNTFFCGKSTGVFHTTES